jgi:hypothetical protein
MSFSQQTPARPQINKIGSFLYNFFPFLILCYLLAIILQQSLPYNIYPRTTICIILYTFYQSNSKVQFFLAKFFPKLKIELHLLTLFFQTRLL